MRGMTLIETILTVTILAIVLGAGLVGVSRLYNRFALESGDAAVRRILVTAEREALAGSQGVSWGMYLPYDEETRVTETVIVFAGESYATRQQNLDRTYRFPSSTKFTSVHLSGPVPSDGNDHEVVFRSLTGSTDQYGTISLTILEKVSTITISPEGLISR